MLTEGSHAGRPAANGRAGRLVASGLLVVFALLGDDLLRIIGISLSGVRVGGGILLMLLSIDIVFGRPIGPGPTAAEHGADDAADISVFPLATPIIAGPGAITAVVVQATAARNGIWPPRCCSP